MTTAKVYFTNMSTELGDSLLEKLRRLVLEAGMGTIDMEKKFVAIKIHFGEYGNLAFLRPNYAKVIADSVKDCSGIPFLTDCNTLYVGKRKHAVEHMDTANLNGFNTTTTGCQIIIGDGLKGTDDVEIPINGEYVETAKIGRAVADADVIITLNHFKFHELTGMGGAMKNLGMGCASRRGKMELHTSGKPSVTKDACRGCSKCLGVCAQDAITVTEKKAFIGHDVCVGCGRCIGACPFDAIMCELDEGLDVINFKIAEYSKAVVDGKPNFHVSLIVDVSPFCDCHGENDVPVIPDVGMLASFDPVALDRACVDLAQAQPVIKGSRLDIASGGIRPDDIFACVHPTTKWRTAFDHAEKIGLGTTDYELITVR